MKTLSSGIILFAKKNPVLNGQFKEFYRLIDQFHRSDSKILALSSIIYQNQPYDKRKSTKAASSSRV